MIGIIKLIWRDTTLIQEWLEMSITTARHFKKVATPILTPQSTDYD